MSLEPLARDDRLTIFVNGWLNWDTGSRIFLNVISHLLERKLSFRFLIAGMAVCDDAVRLVQSSHVEYLGKLPQSTVLQIYRIVDLVLTYYDPSVQINRYAESNKWGDCIAMRVPFVVNSEVETARKFVLAGAAFSCPYDDSVCLANLLEAMVRNRKTLEVARKSISGFDAYYPLYEIQVKDLVNRVVSIALTNS